MSRNKTYYQQHPCGDGIGYRPRTLTVGELIEQLEGFDRALPIIFRSPQSGCYGPHTGYALDGAVRETLDAREEHYPATTWFDEENGVEIPQEAYTNSIPAWDGVVVS